MPYRSFFYLALLCCCSCLFVACTQPKSSNTPAASAAALRIAVVANGTSGSLDFLGAPAIIARDPIFLQALQQQGISLHWEPVTTAAVATLVNESFINDKIDFAFYGNLPAVVLNASGVKTQIVVPGGTGSNVYLIVPPDSKAKSIVDLKGKKIALHRGRPWEINFNQLLSAHHLTLKDFEIVNLNPQAAAAALAAKSVDGFFSLSDALVLEQRQLGKVIWSSRDYPDDWKMRAELWGRSDYIQQHPEITQLLADATVRAYYWIAQHQREYQHSLTRFGQPLQVIQLEQANKNKSWQNNWSPLYQENQLRQHYQRVIDYAQHSQLIRSSVAVDSLLNRQFTDTALQHLQLSNYWQP
jgi:sulfonate transport system substrate-binding protein